MDIGCESWKGRKMNKQITFDDVASCDRPDLSEDGSGWYMFCILKNGQEALCSWDMVNASPPTFRLITEQEESELEAFVQAFKVEVNNALIEHTANAQD